MANNSSSGSKTKSNFRIGFDLGGTKMMASLIDADGKVCASEKIASEGYNGAKEGVKRMIALCRSLLSEQGVKESNVEAIGIACPGVVDLEKGILIDAPNLGWRHAPIAKPFRSAFSKAKVSILNDVDAGTYGEYRYGAGKGARTVLGVFPGTGLGGGCIYDGKLIRGKRLSCMEIGNLRLPSVSLFGSAKEPPRIEEFVSRLGLASAAAVSAYRGDAPTILNDQGTDIRKIKSGAIAAAVRAGDPAMLEAFDNFTFYLAISVAGAIDLLAPDRLVLGGGLVEKMPEEITKSLKRDLERLASPGLTDDLKICVASLGDAAVVAGAAAYASENS